METNVSDDNLVIITKQERIQRLIKVYKKIFIFIIAPLVWMPIAFVGQNNAYLSFYVFLVNATYLVANIFQPGVTSLIPIAIFTIFGSMGRSVINTINISNSVLDCLGVMLTVIAIEQSKLHKRIAIKILLTFGCSHFRLSFLLFFSTMLLSMWFTNTMACGVMMPVMRAVLGELEKMGMLETFEMQKTGSSNYENNESRPTDFTIFYFLGIAYSSSIGGICTLIGSESNRLFKIYSATIFPASPTLELPHLMLLTLPGVLIMEMCLYLWLNFYFLGMMRVQYYSSVQARLSNEEQQYACSLLATQHAALGPVPLHEIVVGSSVILTAILQSMSSMSLSVAREKLHTYSLMNCYSPSIICSVIFFITPVNLDFVKSLKHGDNLIRVISVQKCLTWSMVRKNIHWSVLFVTASGNITFEAMKQAKMTEEFEKFLSLFSSLPAPALALIVIVFCKILTEFANNVVVANCLLPYIANLSISSKLNPRYLMASATIAASLPFHLITGTPAYAMVAAYVGIPPSKMMVAGVGPSLAAVLTNLFTAAVWSKVIWPNIDTFPEWANVSHVDI